MIDTPTWLEGIELYASEVKPTNQDFDVSIIGGGITGITTAYLLSTEGFRVALYDKETSLSQHSTGHTTAIITSYIDTNLDTLINSYSVNTAKLVWESGEDATSFIENTIKKKNIDCEFTRIPYCVFAKNKSQLESLEKEYQAAQKLKIDSNYSASDHFPINSRGHSMFSNQAKFHPTKYLAALIKLAVKNGVHIYTNYEVKDLRNLKSKSVVVATHLPFNEPRGLRFKKAVYSTYMLEIKFPKNSLPEAAYQDLDEPYHYFRVDKLKTHDRVLIGGEDHRRDIPVSQKKCIRALKNYVQKTFTDKDFKVTRHWRGRIIETIDGLPYIGSFEKEPNIYYATGFSGNGMTFGTLSAIMITDQIKSRKNKYAELYSPSRWPTIPQLASKFVDYSRILVGGAIKNTVT